MDIKRRVALRIKTIRKARGLTQDDLAGMIDRSVDTISALERAVNLPTYETLDRLAAGLGVPLSALFEEAEAGSPKRTRTLERLLDAARALSDAELEKLAAISEVMAGRK